MKKEILTKGVLLPLIIGIVLAVVFFVFLSNTNALKPVSDGTVFAYRDEIGADSAIVEVDKLSSCKANDCIGSFNASGEDIIVRYNADYSNMMNALSFVDGVEFGNGVAYLKANESVADSMKNAKKCIYSGTFGTHTYVYSQTKEYDSEHLALMDAQSISSGVIVLYQPVEKYGLTSSFNAVIFEEVA